MVLIGYWERRIALRACVTELKTTTWHLSRRPLIRCPPIGDPAPSPTPQPQHLPAAEPAHHRLPVLGLLRGGGGDRQTFCPGRHGRVRRHDLRYARRAHRPPDAHREFLR